ncbi:peptidase T [Candidatus Fermentibacteria bacterium]|nr:MAG: peptidase T [Candidatus Fermentibacteria bacterium]
MKGVTLNSLTERFLRYVKVATASNPDCADSPSSPEQFDLLRILEKEMKEIGLENVFLSKTGVLYGSVPGGSGTVTLGLIAHVDTSPESPGENVNPVIHENWDGSPISPGEGVTIDPAECADIMRYVGGTIITTDGTTLLGADDKAGVAIIMEACRIMMENPEMKRPRVVVAFTPDEEVGRGVDNFDTSRFGADFAYTIDGGEVTEIASETFNAWSADWKITGREVHPGSGHGSMVNAVRIAGELISMIRPEEMPENSQGREGYDYPLFVKGTTGEAEVRTILRDFTTEGMEQRRRRMEAVRDSLRCFYPEASIELEMKEQYCNPGEILSRDRRLVEYALEGFRNCGIDVHEGAIRGGTDGSRLSFMGVPTANLPTGGELFHSRREWISPEGMGIALSGLIKTLGIWGENI